MKKILSSIFACVGAIAAMAQANVAVTYSVTNCDTDRGEPYSYEMTLMGNAEKSLYFNRMSLYVDSCNSTPEGKARLREIQLEAWRVVQPDGTVTYDGRKLGIAPEKKEYLYVEKNFAAGTENVYDYFGDGIYRYSEPAGEMEWTVVGDSTAAILGYQCVMARTDYHGRTWTAWFTPEIPLHDGPWKLCGLPGLILRADGGDGFLVEATEVGMTRQTVPEIYSADTYEAGERRRLLADREHYINNLESMLAAQGIKLNADGTPGDISKYNRRLRAWETDY